MTDPKTQEIQVAPLTGLIGAEIKGLDLTRALTEEQNSTVFQAFLDHKVLVIRGQQAISRRQLADFCRLFGEPEIEEHPQHGADADTPEVKVLRSDAGNEDEDRDSSWHMDGSTRGADKRLWVSILQAVEVPEYGRDTAFVDMERAFHRLSEPMQTFVSGLKAIHSWGWVKPGAPTSEHDVAPIHSYTGRRTLYVSPFYTTDIVGLRPDESDLLLKFLLSKVHRLEHQVRVSWEPGTIVIWDNARTLHYPIMDRPFPRVMHRVMTLLPEGDGQAQGQPERERAIA